MSMALSLSFVRFGCRADPGSAGTVPAKKRCDFAACPPDSAKRTRRVRVVAGQLSARFLSLARGAGSYSLAPRSGERVGRGAATEARAPSPDACGAGLSPSGRGNQLLRSQGSLRGALLLPRPAKRGEGGGEGPPPKCGPASLAPAAPASPPRGGEAIRRFDAAAC